MKILEMLMDNKLNDYFKNKGLKEEITIKKIGDLHITTGMITINDPLVLYETVLYDKQIKPGDYPLYVYEHSVCHHNVNAFLEIRILDKKPVRYIESLKIESESGTIGFMDGAIEDKLMSLSDDEAESLWNEFNDMYEANQFIDYSLDNISIIGIKSGYGNGKYISYYGLDDQNELCCILVDFQTVNIENIDYSKQPKYYWGSSFDEGEWHYKKIIKDQLPLNRLAGYNHLAIYLRWAMEHHLLSESLLKWFPELPSIIMQKKIDIREILDQSPIFEGKLSKEHFNELGKEFTDDFYRFNMFSTDYYPTCVDDWAETFLGSEKYHCEEYKDEAYLFVPYDEVYYQGLSKYIDKKWKEFINNKYQ